MPRIAWLLPCLFLSFASAAESNPVEKLIQQLGSKDPKTRDLARRALEKLGPEALPVLRKALTHPELEVRRHIGEVVPRIESAEMMKPKLVTLKAEKKTARQMLDELAKQTGYKMDMWNDNQQEVFTLDLDRVPFWKAVDEIGKLSGLSPLIGYGDDRLRFQKQRGYPAHVSTHGAFRFVPTNFEYHRSLGFRSVGPDRTPDNRSETLTLNFTLFSEPKLPMLSIVEPIIQEAIDSAGKPLMAPAIHLQPEDGPRPVVRRTARYGNGYASTSMQGSVPLGLPSEKARGLKLLRLAIPVTILVEQKPAIVTDKILEVKKKKFKVGTTTFEVESCEINPQKQYQLKMSVSEEGLEQDDFTWMNSLYRRVELEDEKGNKYQNFGSSWSHSANNHVQVTFNYGHNGGAAFGPPRKLSYQVWKTMSYQLEVEQRDLPLP